MYNQGYIIPYGSSMSVGGDPYYNNTVLILDPNYSDGLQNRAYSVITPSSSIVRSSTQAKFGTYSLYADGSTYMTFADSENWNLTGEFTIEIWLYVPTSFLRQNMRLFASAGGVVAGAMLSIGNDQNIAGTGYPYYTVSLTLGGYTGRNVALPLNQWVFLSVTRSGSSIFMHQDGTKIGTTLTSSVASDFSPSPSGMKLSGTGWASEGFKGYIGGARITKGVARYSTANYTAPTEAFITVGGVAVSHNVATGVITV